MNAATLQSDHGNATPLHAMSLPGSFDELPSVDFREADDGSKCQKPDRSGVCDRPSREEVKAALARVLDSATFRHSVRHRAFLRYVVENTLAGRARAVKEVVIGLDVFGRELDGFDPRRDSIVRVEARRLRKKLRSYYDGEGRADSVEIRLEVGGYVPTFAYRERFRTPRVSVPLVLVVPFNTIADGSAELVATGLCDQLTDSLAAIDGIRVMATFAASRVHPTVDGWDRCVVPDDLDYVVDGSMMRLGSRWRCIAHVTSMPDGLRRWSRSFDFGPIEGEAAGTVDFFALRDRIADALCAAMRVELKRIG